MTVYRLWKLFCVYFQRIWGDGGNVSAVLFFCVLSLCLCLVVSSCRVLSACANISIIDRCPEVGFFNFVFQALILDEDQNVILQFSTSAAENWCLGQHLLRFELILLPSTVNI